MVAVSVLQQHIPTTVVDTPRTITTSMEVARGAQRQVLTMVVELLPTTTIDMVVVLALLQQILIMAVATPLITTTDTVVAQVVQRRVLTMVVEQLPTTTTSMAVVSVLLRHIPTMAVEQLQPTMTFMVTASAPAAIGDKRIKPHSVPGLMRHATIESPFPYSVANRVRRDASPFAINKSQGENNRSKIWNFQN